MRCPRCRKPSQVLDSRLLQDNSVRRRRRCLKCRFKWTTYEQDATANRASAAGHRRVVEKLIEGINDAVSACWSELKGR